MPTTRSTPLLVAGLLLISATGGAAAATPETSAAPDDADSLRIDTGLKRCGDLFAAGSFLEAAECFEAESAGRDLPAGIAEPTAYNVAVAFEKAGRPERALAAYDAFAEAHPKHELASVAAYAASTLRLRLGDYAGAAAAAERMAVRYPHDRRGPEALLTAASLYEALDQDAKAVFLYGRWLKHTAREDPDRAAEVAVRVATVLARDEHKAAAAWGSFLETFGALADPGWKLHARLEIARRAPVKRRAKELDRIIRDGAGLDSGDPRVAGAAAEALLLLADLDLARFEALRPPKKDPPAAGWEKALKTWLEVATKRLTEARNGYKRVLEYPGSATVAVEAWERIGRLYLEMYRRILARVDPEADAEMWEMYRSSVDDIAAPILATAVDAFERCVATASDLEWVGEAVARCHDSLHTIDSRRYPALVERWPGARSAPPLALPIVARPPVGADLPVSP